MNILLVNDGSSQAENALRFGAQIARRVSIPPTILAVIDQPVQNAPSEAEAIQKRSLDLVDNIEVRTLVCTGDAYEQIIIETNQGDYDLVIIGDKRPRNLLRRILWRSSAVKVAEHAPCSVVIVRGMARSVHRILLCDSGVEGSSLLSRLIVQLAAVLEGEEDVTVLHVMSQVSAGPGVRGKHLRAGAEELIQEHTPEGELLEHDINMLDVPGIHPTPKVRHGLVVDEILAEARSGDYDLVVVGAHPLTSEGKFLLDNIGHQVLKNIDRPILVVRNKEVRERAS
jgi:nucleotide-binding universal stress UspA family protein